MYTAYLIEKKAEVIPQQSKNSSKVITPLTGEGRTSSGSNKKKKKCLLSEH